MKNQVIELAPIKLAEGATEAQLVEASTAFQTAFLETQDGFVRRDFVRKSDGTYMDIIQWESRDYAEAVFEKAKMSDVAARYFGLMEFDLETMDEGVEHCALLASFPRR